jgi:phosphatidylglycerol---prolipoprotein diacylglyceryl transferase
VVSSLHNLLSGLPFVRVDSFHFLGITVHAFSLLVGAGVLCGFLLAVNRGAGYGISRERIALFSLFLIVGGIAGARFGRILYEPDLLRQAITNPALVFLRFHGITSFGGYFGGLAGALLFFRLQRYSRTRALQFLDSVGFALPFAWFFGRVGCALVHDHPGILSDGWLTVAFPGGSRYDLGLLEALFLLLLAAIFGLLSLRNHQPGFFFALYFSVYGPFRFFLDRLHVDPPQYFGLTVDQYGAALATITGIVTFCLMRTTQGHHAIPETIDGIHVRSVSRP